MKNKILVIICTFVLCFSLLVIPSFALENDFTGEYEFAYDLDFSSLNINGSYFDFRVMFTCQDVDYEMISFVYNAQNNFITMNYWTEDTSTLVYNSSYGWVNDEYRFINISEYDTQSPYLINFLAFLNDNVFVPEPNYNGWYYDIYDIIRTALFDDYELNSAQDMAITLVALLLSVGAVLLPVFLILRIGKTLLMSRYM